MGVFEFASVLVSVSCVELVAGMQELPAFPYQRKSPPGLQMKGRGLRLVGVREKNVQAGGACALARLGERARTHDTEREQSRACGSRINLSSRGLLHLFPRAMLKAPCLPHEANG